MKLHQAWVVGSLLVSPNLVVSAAPSSARAACVGFEALSLDSPVTCIVGDDVEVSPGGGLGQASYNDSLVDTSGWFVLDSYADADVGTDAGSNNADDTTAASALMAAAYSAGVAEGILSCEQVAQFAYNVLVSSFGRGYPATAGPSQDLLDFIEANDAWVKSQVMALGATEDYWLAVGQVMATMDGILEGLNLHSPCSQQPNYQPMSRLDLLLVNLDGDLFDLTVAFPGPPGGDDDEVEENDAVAVVAGTAAGEGHLRHHRKGRKDGINISSSSSSSSGGNVTSQQPTSELRCSALFKLLEDGSDVFFGHDTWDTYATAAPRIFKTIRLPVRRDGVVIRHVDSFSSSPGFVASVDDYYVLGGTSRLTVIETSNEVFNTSAYAYLTPESNMCWVRTMAANMIATNGSSWSDAFGAFHSGTYNNQWMLLDADKFSIATAPASTDSSSSAAAAAAAASTSAAASSSSSATSAPASAFASPGLFWVLEEAPGLIHAEDQTEALVAEGYWASYNIAFYDDIRERLGDNQPYATCPRANLFREMQTGVVDLPSMQKLLGWNDFENDPNSLGKPSNAIMARDDLLTPTGYAGGGIDSKLSSLQIARNFATAKSTTTTTSTSSTSGAGTSSGSSGKETEGEDEEDSLTSFARAGPTHDSLAPFCWGTKEAFDVTPHHGHPECFNYSWAPINPSNPIITALIFTTTTK